MRVVPEDWMPECEMKRIICHWTAGVYDASDDELEHYHILVLQDGSLVCGSHPIDANAKPIGQSYAAHTLRCNTESIGISVCCMADAIESPFSGGKCPMTEWQWEVLAQVAADLAQRYGISVTPQTILGHGEVESNLGIEQRGKWDPLMLPWQPHLSKKEVGDRFRARVQTLLAMV
jgi:N-acetyl-anhydromuramyl-L-alanine amidase AmpD